MLLRILFIVANALAVATLAQPEIKFTKGARIKSQTFSNAFAYDGKSIFVPDQRSNIAHLYPFKHNYWEKLQFPATDKSRFRRVNFSTYIQSIDLVVMVGEKIEMLNLFNLVLTKHEVDGGYPVKCGYAVDGSKLYFFGGTVLEGKFLGVAVIPDLFCLDFATGSIATLAKLPYPLIAKGSFSNGTLFVPGGLSNEIALKSVLKYSVESNSWTVIGHLPSAIKDYALASAENQIFIAGCRDDIAYLGIYDTAKNDYREYRTNLPFVNGNLVAHEGRLYFFGGIDRDNWQARNNRIYSFDLNQLPSAEAISCANN